MRQVTILIFPASIAATITSAIFLFAGFVKHGVAGLQLSKNSLPESGVFAKFLIIRVSKFCLGFCATAAKDVEDLRLIKHLRIKLWKLYFYTSKQPVAV